jgi:hypothetical protein
MSQYDLTKGTAKRGNDRQGGLKKIYLTEYVDYSRSQVVISGQRITSIPTATIYEYDVHGASFEETQSREDGGEVYSQKLSFVVQGTRNSEEFWKLTKKPHHCIILDEQGNGRFLLEVINQEQISQILMDTLLRLTAKKIIKLTLYLI